MKLYHLALLLILCGCSPLIKKTITDSSVKPLSDTAQVVLVDVTQPMPDSCKTMGTLHYGENGTSPSWGYNKLIQEAKKQARTMGGNVIKITSLESPQEGYSNAYTMYVTVLYRQNLSNISNRLKMLKDSIHRIKFPEANPTYAILYIYRPPGLGALVVYDVELNDKVICEAKNNSFYEIKLYQEGEAKLKAVTEAAVHNKIDVKFGEEYYLKCGVRMGVLIGEPLLQIIPNWQGSLEYTQLKNRKK